MNGKRIVYIHTGEWPSDSPSIVFVTGTAYGLSAQSHVTLMVRNNSESDTAEIFRSLTGSYPPDTLEIDRFGMAKRTPGHGTFFRYAVRRIKEQARKGEVEAIITRSIGFLPYLAYVRKRYNLPCFFETHDFFTDLSRRTDMKSTLHVRRNSFYERTFFPRITGLICLTRCQEELFRRYYPDVPIKIAHSGLFNVVKSEKQREKRICYVGSLDSHKGIGLMLNALAQTADKDIGLLVIGGKNEHEMREFMKLADLIGVADRVLITGWVHHSDIGHMMDRCMAGAVPLSNTPFNRHITSPLKILDCFSRSLPVIGSDLPPVREYVENGRHGLLFEPDNAENLAEIFDRFAAGDMFDSMSKAIEEYAPRFHYRERARTILEFIRETV